MLDVIFDIESYGDDENNLKAELNCQKFTIGGLLKDNGVYKEYTSPNEMVYAMLDLVDKERKRNGRTFFWGFNTQYDFYAVFRDYLKENCIIEFPDGRQIKYFSFYPFMAILGRQKGKRFIADAYFLDLMSYFRMPLKELGHLIGLEKMEMPTNPKSIEEIKPYLKRDCEITLKGLQKMKSIIHELGFKPKRYLTAGNTAITCFLTDTQKNKLNYVYAYKGRTYQGKYINEFRSGFRGGRFECFKTGEWNDCIKIDCNAMYPYLMINMDFPDLRKEFYTKDKEEIKMAIQEKIGILKCRIKCPQSLTYGYLPIRLGTLTYYPTNKEIEGMWTTLEIKKALSLGYEIVELYDCVYFNKAPINPFKDYLTRMWEIRKTKTGIEKEVIKLLMNSLFGKWSQYRTEEEMKIIERHQLKEYITKGYRFMKTAQEKYVIHRKGKISMPRYANPMISIWITALGRDYIYETMQKINPSDLLYIATDGIIMKKPSNFYELGLKLGNDIGEFKIEDEGYCKILGENRYRFNDKIKIGGIPKRDISIDVFEGKKKVTVQKIISVKQAMNNKALQDKIGTFETEEIQITESCKGDIALPKLIIEPNKFEGIFELNSNGESKWED